MKRLEPKFKITNLSSTFLLKTQLKFLSNTLNSVKKVP